MTEPDQPAPDLDAARLRLDTAISQLVEPEQHRIDRDGAATRAELHERRVGAGQQHLAVVRGLSRRLAAARTLPARRVAAAVAAVHRDLRQAGARHRAHLAALADTPALRATTTTLPPLLDQLTDAVTSAGGAGSGSRGVHRSPLNTTAVELLSLIRRTLGVPDAAPLAPALRAWQPSDATAADHAERWVVDARAIVSPARWTEAARPCPACGTRHVWISEDGQRIRKAAIQVNLTDGYAACIAPSCPAWWPRERFDLLAAALQHDDVLTA